MYLYIKNVIAMLSLLAYSLSSIVNWPLFPPSIRYHQKRIEPIIRTPKKKSRTRRRRTRASSAKLSPLRLIVNFAKRKYAYGRKKFFLEMNGNFEELSKLEAPEPYHMIEVFFPMIFGDRKDWNDFVVVMLTAMSNKSALKNLQNIMEPDGLFSDYDEQERVDVEDMSRNCAEFLHLNYGAEDNFGAKISDGECRECKETLYVWRSCRSCWVHYHQDPHSIFSKSFYCFDPDHRRELQSDLCRSCQGEITVDLPRIILPDDVDWDRDWL